MQNDEKISTYRQENESVYRFDPAHNAYVFAGKLRGRKLSQFVTDYEEFLLTQWETENRE